jgi:hypothetical protein
MYWNESRVASWTPSALILNATCLPRAEDARGVTHVNAAVDSRVAAATWSPMRHTNCIPHESPTETINFVPPASGPDVGAMRVNVGVTYRKNPTVVKLS